MGVGNTVVVGSNPILFTMKAIGEEGNGKLPRNISCTGIKFGPSL